MDSVKEFAGTVTAIAIWVALIVLTVGAWIQHFITTISDELWVLLVLGAIVPPIGMLHGWLVWAGVL